jgi:hypothetical protein
MSERSDWRRAVSNLAHKSEKLERKYVVSSFVDMGHLAGLLGPESQYVYGRRGVGKTHLLKFLVEKINEHKDNPAERDLAVFVDARDLLAESDLQSTGPKAASRRIFKELLRLLHFHLQAYASNYLWQNALPTPRSAEQTVEHRQSTAALEELDKAIRIGVRHEYEREYSESAVEKKSRQGSVGGQAGTNNGSPLLKAEAGGQPVGKTPWKPGWLGRAGMPSLTGRSDNAWRRFLTRTTMEDWSW